MKLAVIFPLFLYLLLIYALAAFCKRNLAKSKNFMEDYFIGGRKMGGFVLAMTLVATYISASSFIGGPGIAYKIGLGWVLLAMIQLPTAWLTLGVLGKKFALIARKINAVTINDFLWARYRNRAVVIIGSAAIVVFFITAMVAQFIGGARLFEAVTGLSYTTGLCIFAGTVILYTTLGGFRAVVLTDAVQGVIMMIGTLALLWGILSAGDGMGALVQKLGSIDPGLISPVGPDNFLSQPFILSFWVLVCFGVIALPQTAVRCFGYKNSRSMHTAIVLGTFVLGFIVLGMHLCGALGRAILPDLTVADTIMPRLSLEVLPPVVVGIFLAGPLAAIMSTIDSQLILASATLIKDLYLRYILQNPDKKEPDMSKVDKLSFYTTALLGLIVFVAALNPPDLIVWLNLFAFGGLQAAFLWPMALGLYWSRAESWGALASMLTGISVFVCLTVLKIKIGGTHAIVPTLVLALLVFAAVSLWRTKGNPELIFWWDTQTDTK